MTNLRIDSFGDKSEYLGRQMGMGQIMWHKTQLTGYQCLWIE